MRVTQPDDAGVTPETACPLGPVVEVLFSRWTSPILWTLNEYGRQRFGELERRITTITPKVLTQRLRQLERDGLVMRTHHAEVPPRVEYEISALGRTVEGLFTTMTAWGNTNLAGIETARRRYDSTAQLGRGHRAQ